MRIPRHTTECVGIERNGGEHDGGSETTVDARARALVDALKARDETVGWCESLTAGLACATLAEVPGASAVLRGGLVTYATELKHTLAGVSAEVLRVYGPVAEATAREMAAGARKRLISTWAVSLTGVAGPASQDGHPVGEVWVGYSGPGIERAERLRLAGTRAEIRGAAVHAAFDGLMALLGNAPA